MESGTVFAGNGPVWTLKFYLEPKPNNIRTKKMKIQKGNITNYQPYLGIFSIWYGITHELKYLKVYDYIYQVIWKVTFVVHIWVVEASLCWFISKRDQLHPKKGSSCKRLLDTFDTYKVKKFKIL